MSDEITPKKSHKTTAVAKRVARTVKKIIKTPAFRYLLLIIFIGLAGYGLFYAGQQNGIKTQKAIDAKNRTSTRIPGSTLNPDNKNAPSQNRRSIIGTLTKIDGNNLEVKDRAGKITKIKLDDKTQITGSDLKKTDAKALKADQKVIITGTKNSDKSLTATRVRIQR